MKDQRRSLVVVFVVVFLAFGLALGSALAQQKPKMPADFSFEMGKGSPGTVTFSHERHFDKNPKCTECHPKVFKMKKGTSGKLTMVAMNEGKFCGACHNGSKAFSTKDTAGCTRCHGKG